MIESVYSSRIRVGPETTAQGPRTHRPKRRLFRVRLDFFLIKRESGMQATVDLVPLVIRAPTQAEEAPLSQPLVKLDSFARKRHVTISMTMNLGIEFVLSAFIARRLLSNLCHVSQAIMVG